MFQEETKNKLRIYNNIYIPPNSLELGWRKSVCRITTVWLEINPLSPAVHTQLTELVRRRRREEGVHPRRTFFGRPDCRGTVEVHGMVVEAKGQGRRGSEEKGFNGGQSGGRWYGGCLGQKVRSWN